MSQTSAGISSDGTTTTSPSASELSPIPHSPIEESDQVTLVSALPVDTIDVQTSETYLPNNEASYNPTMVVITSPSFNSDLSSEQNETIDEINPSSLAFLQTKQHRANHRRNKSEPVRSLSIDDIPSTITTTLESSLPNATNDESSSLSNNSLNENKRKSSMKTPPSNTSPVTSIKQITQDKSSSSTTSTRKKKPWYNVSIPYFYDY